jgi:hypothetical protein
MGDRNRQGRRLIEASARSGELPDRLAGIEEMHAAARYAAVLAPRIQEIQRDVVALRQAFLVKRVERRQAETLIQETEARDAVETGRRDQQGLDDWYRNRMHREELSSKSDEASPAASEDGLYRLLRSELESESAESQD